MALFSLLFRLTLNTFFLIFKNLQIIQTGQPNGRANLWFMLKETNYPQPMLWMESTERENHVVRTLKRVPSLRLMHMRSIVSLWPSCFTGMNQLECVCRNHSIPYCSMSSRKHTILHFLWTSETVSSANSAGHFFYRSFLFIKNFKDICVI